MDIALSLRIRSRSRERKTYDQEALTKKKRERRDTGMKGKNQELSAKGRKGRIGRSKSGGSDQDSEEIKGRRREKGD